MFRARITVFPDVPGGFSPDSFADLVQREIHLPGLDQAWTHTLVDVTVAADRGSAELTVHSEPLIALSLDRHVRVEQGVPAARVRVHDQAGTVLAEAALAAPLRHGQEIVVNGVHHTVQSHEWPGRHPETGVCVGELDWQHVVVAAQPRPTVEPVAAS